MQRILFLFSNLSVKFGFVCREKVGNVALADDVGDLLEAAERADAGLAELAAVEHKDAAAGLCANRNCQKSNREGVHGRYQPFYCFNYRYGY